MVPEGTKVDSQSDGQMSLSDLLETLEAELVEQGPQLNEPSSPYDVLLVCFTEPDGETYGSEVSHSCEE